MSSYQSCLICDAPVVDGKKSSTGGDKIKCEITTFFMIRKLLEVSYSTCVNLLQNEGDPSSWCPCCEKCFSIAFQAKEICGQVAKLESQYKRVKESLEFEIRKNIVSTTENNIGVVELLREEILSRLKKDDRKEFLDEDDEIHVKSEIKLEFEDMECDSSSIEDYQQEENNFRETRKNRKRICTKSIPDYADSPDVSITHDFVEESGRIENVSAEYPCFSSSPNVMDCDDSVFRFSKRNLRPLNRIPQIPFETSPTEEKITKDFACRFCKKVALTNTKIKIHEQRNHGVKHTYDCENCGKVYTFWDTLREHYKKCSSRIPASNKTPTDTTSPKVQNDATAAPLPATENSSEEANESCGLKTDEGKFSCQHCAKEFDTMEKQYEHENGMHDENHEFQCKSCSECFTRQRTLRIHIRQEHKTENVQKTDPIKCRFCSEVFQTQKKLEQHNHKDHKELLPPLNCEHCGRQFSDKTHLKGHVKRVHNISDSAEFVCNYCRKAFKTGFKLKFHILRHHKDKSHPHPLECPQCGFISSSSGALKMHIDTVHEKLRSHICEHCPKTFTRRQYLKFHLVKEHNVVFGQGCDNLKCSLCEKVFSTGAYLREHIRGVHENKYKFYCPICKLGAMHKSRMAEHIRVVHSDIKKEICEVCGKGFSNRGGLNTHMKYHNNVKSFTCTQCGKGFVNNHGLKRHEETHNQDKTFKCDQCPKAFPSAHYLGTHKWYAHQGRKSKQPPKNIIDKEIIEQVISNANYSLNDEIITPSNVSPSMDS